MLKNVRIKMRHVRLFITLFVGLAVVPILYQNCSPPPPESGDLGSVADSAPFAFEERVDHIAYMSCSGMPSGFDPKAYFTFKVGAYRSNSGLRLNNAFIYATRNLATSDKALALAQSSANRGAVLELTIRNKSLMQQALNLGYKPAGFFIGSVTQSAVSGPLVNNIQSGMFYNNFGSLNTFFPGLVDTIILAQTETTMEDYRGKLGSDYLLSLTYNKDGTDSAIVPTGNVANSPYGTGFNLTFKEGFIAPSSGVTINPKRVLASVKESNLATGVQLPSTAWDCNAGWSYQIIQQSDTPYLPVGVCSWYRANPNTDPTPTDSAKIEALRVLRTLLAFEDWAIDIDGRCIIPKKAGSCYGSSAAVNYVGAVNPACPGSPGVTCVQPHYVSICKRL